MRAELFQHQFPAPRKPADRWSDDAVLEAVADAYQRCADSAYALTTRPDQLDRNSAEVDGLLECNGHPPVAIEVTALESFVGQLLDESRVERLLGSFQLELARELPNGLW